MKALAKLEIKDTHFLTILKVRREPYSIPGGTVKKNIQYILSR